MGALLHPAYREEMGLLRRDGCQAVRMNEGLYSGRQDITASKVPGTIRLGVFLSGVAVGVAGALLLSALGGRGAQGIIQGSSSGVALGPPTKIESEVELLKHIVSGLVQSVTALSTKERGSPSAAKQHLATYPIPVKVITQKAHLRRAADRAAPSIVEVPRDTTLLAFDGNDGWLKVTTPRGEDAWVSRAVVSEVGT